MYSYIIAFLIGAVLAFFLTNSIRMYQIKNLKQELNLVKQEKERVAILLK